MHKNTFLPTIIIVCAVGISSLFSCTKRIYVPVETVKEVRITDTTYLHKTDTLIKVPDVSIADFIDLKDTLVMQTGIVTSKSWVDTTMRALKGRLTQNGKLPVQIVERERVVYKDSISRVEVPVEVDKPVPYTPKFWKFFGWLGILSLVAGVLLLLHKFGVL